MMKNKHLLLVGLLIVIPIWIGINHIISRKTIVKHVPGSCTIFSACIGDKTLYGNNEDYNTPDIFYWTEPASNENYGCIYLGFENENNSYQGGINEKGLCFDANSLPISKINLHDELPTPPFTEPPYEEDPLWVAVSILRKAATVEEAIKIATKYRRTNWDPSGYLAYQLNLADAKGDAVIIGVDKNGELAFTKKNKGDKYLVSTNFNRANPTNAWTYPCRKYNKASEMLEQIKNENDLSVDYFKSILDSVHAEGAKLNTIYSNIFDLKKGIIYLYYWHQFDEVAVLNVQEELAKGIIKVRIKDLFSQEIVDKASKEFQEYKSNNN